jgi:hypothetical protein
MTVMQKNLDVSRIASYRITFLNGPKQSGYRDFVLKTATSNKVQKIGNSDTTNCV